MPFDFYMDNSILRIPQDHYGTDKMSSDLYCACTVKNIFQSEEIESLRRANELLDISEHKSGCQDLDNLAYS